MVRHLLQRFLLTLPALWLVLTLVFLMIHIVPGNPAATPPIAPSEGVLVQNDW